MVNCATVNRLLNHLDDICNPNNSNASGNFKFCLTWAVAGNPQLKTPLMQEFINKLSNPQTGAKAALIALIKGQSGIETILIEYFEKP